ncbi:MAG: hypothetical protein QOJ25_2294 [Solirubrobacteraceae bacterium]|nr:hypothetical protein [Solirubrobacteraceae bacterium]
MVGPASRRAFLRLSGASLAGGSGALLTACGGGSGAKRKLVAGSEPAAVRRADISIMNGVLDLEHTAIAAYTAGIPLLTGRARAAATRFLRQELSHASKLHDTIKGAGGKPHLAKASYDLGSPDSETDVLDMLRALEKSLLSAYLAAIPELMPGWLRAVAAGILANEAQHISVLRSVQGQRPVPSAFVTASE